MIRAFFRSGLLLIVLIFLSCDLDLKDPDFAVTVREKTSAHPYFGVGSALGYAIDEVEGRELTLKRGTSYTFSINTTDHPFYFSTDAVGGAGAPGEITEGVSVTRVESGTVAFTPTAETPALIYYQCALHPNMGWEINITE